tara:strand:- start:6607 stop:8169 length:1563 start_codon:yes stop_codon:yes gene_type:complete
MVDLFLPGTAEPFERHTEDVDIWVEQQIWGHRFFNDQTPWFLLLEALGVMAAKAGDQNFDRIFPGYGAGFDGRFNYSLQSNLKLRTILFVDRHIDEIASSDAFVSDNTKWTQWFSVIGKSGKGEKEYGYLKERFTKFSAFRNAVDLLRSAEIQGGAKRTTSRHLAPRGPALLSADFGEKKGNKINKDRRFFARGGELFYLMLNRSSQTELLEAKIKERLLTEDSRWNSLAKVLQPDQIDSSVDFENLGYLPLEYHKTYDLAASDWTSVLSLTELPDDNLPEPLMRLSGLAVVRYLIDRSAETLGVEAPPIPLDMVSSATVGVQKISKDCYRLHREMMRNAIGHVVRGTQSDPAWITALKANNKILAATEYMEKRFAINSKIFHDAAPEDYPGIVEKEAIEDHDQHLSRVMGVYAEKIGMAVAKRGSGRWYAAGDGLLEALVLANVTQPIELESFLEIIWQRYKFVVGTEIARKAFKTANYGHFKANQRILEERLRVLGLLNRLSDDCAFVKNPFFKAGSQ